MDLLSKKTPGVVAADGNDHHNKTDEELIHLIRGKPLVDFPSDHSAENTAAGHHNQPQRPEIRQAALQSFIPVTVPVTERHGKLPAYPEASAEHNRKVPGDLPSVP